MKHSFFFTALSSLLFLTFASCSQSFFEYNGNIWATNFHIVYKSDKNLDDSICGIMDSIDKSLSYFNPSSTVSHINGNSISKADGMFAEVFELSKKIHAVSGGRFDPTVRPLVELWGFGKSKPSAAEPPRALIDSALANVGIDACYITQDMTVTKKTPETSFDFSAIAKGYGVDCVARMLERNGCTDYMIEIGGEIALRGHNREGRKWKIQIDAPVEQIADGEIHTRLAVFEFGPGPTAIATSGNYRNYRTGYDGRHFGHTIDSRTGVPVRNTTLSTTVIAGNCATADALATACMAMNADSAISMIERFGNNTSAIIVGPDSSGTEYRTILTKGFPYNRLNRK